jgi:hypothetical protein
LAGFQVTLIGRFWVIPEAAGTLFSRSTLMGPEILQIRSTTRNISFK